MCILVINKFATTDMNLRILDTCNPLTGFRFIYCFIYSKCMQYSYLSNYRAMHIIISIVKSNCNCKVVYLY